MDQVPVVAFREVWVDYREPRIPAKNPAAHPPAAPFSASSFSLVLATTDSVKANVAPIAPVHPEFKRSEPSQ